MSKLDTHTDKHTYTHYVLKWRPIKRSDILLIYGHSVLISVVSVTGYNL